MDDYVSYLGFERQFLLTHPDPSFVFPSLISCVAFFLTFKPQLILAGEEPAAC